MAAPFDLDTPLKGLLHKDQWPTVWEAIRTEVGRPEWPTAIPWPGLLRQGPKTVRELIWHVAGQLPKPTPASGEAWTRSRIQIEIRRIVTKVSEVSDYKLRDRFVQDLKLG